MNGELRGTIENWDLTLYAYGIEERASMLPVHEQS
jgi:hypothetical protein